MTPTVVLDQVGRGMLAIGSPGGGRITYTVLRALYMCIKREREREGGRERKRERERDVNIYTSM